MKIVLRPLAVAYACRGCSAYGDGARKVAALLEQEGLAEASADIAKARARFPVIAIDGCGEGCVRRWLEGQGITPERSFVVEGNGPGAVQHALRRIPADLG